MILTIDVGNTNITCGVFQGDEIAASFRITTKMPRTSDEYGMMLMNLLEQNDIHPAEIKDAIICSVVPNVMHSLRGGLVKYFHITPIVVEAGIKTGIRIVTPNPQQIGADRIVDAVGAYEIYGGPVLVIDFGTANTFCALLPTGEYLGGAIAPGIGISTEALFQRAAKLPRIELVKPKSVICRNTVSSMQAGAIYGFVGQMEGIVNHMKKELGGDAYVIATGGFANTMAAESDCIDVVEPFLTLDGLRILYEKNAK